MQNKRIGILSVLCFVLFFFGFALDAWQWRQDTSTGEAVPAVQQEPQKETIRLVAVGDNLLHMPVINSCKTADGGYDMTPLYANIQPMLKAADISAIGLETVLAGAEFGYSGYPAFNSPQETGHAIADAGFNVVLLASNHAMDMGKKGLLNTLTFWEQYPEITTVGANKTPQEQQTLRIIETKGLKVAILNYTYGLNGMGLAGDRAHLVDIIDKARIANDVENANIRADFIVAFLHWGKEYISEIQPVQQELAQYMADLGVPLIIGAHPHVLAPAEWLTGANGSKTLVYYSLGNYISSQRKLANVLGGAAEIEICRTRYPDGSVTAEITDAALTPLVTYYDRNLRNFTVYPLADYTPEIAAGHGLIRYDRAADPEAFRAMAEALFPPECGVRINN